MSRRPDVGTAIGEINLLGRRGPAHGSDPSPNGEHGRSALAPPDRAQNGNGAGIAASDRRAARRSPRRPRDGELMRAELLVPEELLNRARTLVRPRRTGAERSLGAGFVLQAFVRAVDELALDVDVSGMDLGREDEMVERVKQAIAATLQSSTESEPAT